MFEGFSLNERDNELKAQGLEPGTEEFAAAAREKWKEYLRSSQGKRVVHNEFKKIDEGTVGHMNLEDILIIEKIDSYELDHELIGDVEKDTRFLFVKIGASKLLARLQKGEDATLLLRELRAGMEKIIEFSEQENIKKYLWKAIVTKDFIDQILQQSS